MRFSDENGFYEIDNLPGCTQVAVSHNSVIYEEQRGKGHGTKANELRIEKAKFLGYDYILRHNFVFLKITSGMNLIHLIVEKLDIM
jgi:hypothetical protein